MPVKRSGQPWTVREGTFHGVTPRVQPNNTRRTVMKTDLTGSKGQCLKASGFTKYEKPVAVLRLWVLLAEPIS